jgi:hypothetical protein
MLLRERFGETGAPPRTASRGSFMKGMTAREQRSAPTTGRGSRVTRRWREVDSNTPRHTYRLLPGERCTVPPKTAHYVHGEADGPSIVQGVGVYTSWRSAAELAELTPPARSLSRKGRFRRGRTAKKRHPSYGGPRVRILLSPPASPSHHTNSLDREATERSSTRHRARRDRNPRLDSNSAGY